MIVVVKIVVVVAILVARAISNDSGSGSKHVVVRISVEVAMGACVGTLLSDIRLHTWLGQALPTAAEQRK